MISDWPRSTSNATSVARGERGGHVLPCARKAETVSGFSLRQWTFRKRTAKSSNRSGKEAQQKGAGKVFRWNLQFNLMNVGHTMSRKHAETIAWSHQDLAGRKGDSTWSEWSGEWVSMPPRAAHANCSTRPGWGWRRHGHQGYS